MQNFKIQGEMPSLSPPSDAHAQPYDQAIITAKILLHVKTKE